MYLEKIKEKKTHSPNWNTHPGAKILPIPSQPNPTPDKGLSFFLPRTDRGESELASFASSSVARTVVVLSCRPPFPLLPPASRPSLSVALQKKPRLSAGPYSASQPASQPASQHIHTQVARCHSLAVRACACCACRACTVCLLAAGPAIKLNPPPPPPIARQPNQSSPFPYIAPYSLACNGRCAEPT